MQPTSSSSKPVLGEDYFAKIRIGSGEAYLNVILDKEGLVVFECFDNGSTVGIVLDAPEVHLLTKILEGWLKLGS